MATVLSKDALAGMTLHERMTAQDIAQKAVYAVIHASRAQFGAYGHVRVSFAFVDPTRDVVMPAGFTMGANAELERIGVTCQIDDVSTYSASYGWQVGLVATGSEWHATGRNDLAKALKAVDRMAKGAAKVEAVAGRPVTFGQYVGHHCAALKLAGVLRWDDGQRFRDRGWYSEPADSLVRLVDGEVAAMRKALNAPEVAA